MSNLPTIDMARDEDQADPFVFNPKSEAVQALLKAGVPKERLQELHEDYAADPDFPAGKSVQVEKR